MEELKEIFDYIEPAELELNIENGWQEVEYKIDGAELGMSFGTLRINFYCCVDVEILPLSNETIIKNMDIFDVVVMIDGKQSEDEVFKGLFKKWAYKRIQI